MAAVVGAQEEEGLVAAGNQDDSPIVRAIRESEAHTSGEIRVHLSKRLWEPDPMKSAWRIFKLYQLDQTQQRNAVLLYVNLRHRKFAVIGDVGVDAAFGQTFWRALVHQLGLDFNSTHFERAIAGAVRSVGRALAEHFPPLLDDPNELPDHVSRD